MTFSIDEIRGYLKECISINHAIENLSEQSLIDNIPINAFDSLNYIKNEENLLKYEIFIGMKNRKNEQSTLYANTNGEKGRYWVACSPEWISQYSLESEYEICYWVNYGDDTTYGRFTVEQIKKWFDTPDIFLHDIGGQIEREL